MLVTDGDTTWVKGSVVGKDVTPEGRHVVDLEVRCENQRGVVSAPGTARVILPSKAHGAAVLPEPPTDVGGGGG